MNSVHSNIMIPFNFYKGLPQHLGNWSRTPDGTTGCHDVCLCGECGKIKRLASARELHGRHERSWNMLYTCLECSRMYTRKCNSNMFGECGFWWVCVWLDGGEVGVDIWCLSGHFHLYMFYQSCVCLGRGHLSIGCWKVKQGLAFSFYLRDGWLATEWFGWEGSGVAANKWELSIPRWCNIERIFASFFTCWVLVVATQLAIVLRALFWVVCSFV